MNRRILLIALCSLFVWTLCAQDIFNNDEDLKNDIIKVNYKRKNAKLAMLMSAIVPGAGQFYADKSSITTYIFPVIEAGLIYGYINSMNKGIDMEHHYQNWATNQAIQYPEQDDQGNYILGPRYNAMNFQFPAQDNLIGIHTTDIYDNLYFKWNAGNLEYNQHFYEDIGKYDKYVFGWADWHYEYAYDGQSTVDPNWVWDNNQLSPRWLGNYPTNPDDIEPGQTWQEPNSALRDQYISMRKDAEIQYDHATTFNFAIVANHILSAFDALRVTHAFNRNYLSLNDIHINYRTTMYNSHFTPMLTFNKSF
jgi:hypothetical protein